MRKFWIFLSERQVLLALVLLALGWFLYSIRITLTIFFVGYVFMAGIAPVVAALERRRVPRPLAIAAPYLAGPLLITILLAVYLPKLASESGAFVQALPMLFERASAYFHIGVHLNSSQLFGYFLSLFGFAQGNLVSIAGFIGTLLLDLVAVFAVSVYLLLARRGWYEGMADLVGHDRRRTHELFERIETGVGKWLQGQLILSGVIGGTVWVFLFIVGVPFSGFLGALAALLEIIPYAGPILSAIPAIIVAANLSPSKALVVAIGYIVIHQVEGHLLVPNIMRRSVELQPLVIIAAILAGGELAGILGALLAIPIVTVIRVLARQAGWLGRS